jgi:AsmA protein
LKRIAVVLGIFVVLLLAAALAISFLVDVNQFRPALEAKLSAVLGRDVRVADLSLSILSGSLTARDLSIGEDPSFGKTAFVHAEALKVSIALMPLIRSRELNVTGITVYKPDINLVQNVQGVWNFSGLGAGVAKPAPKAALAPGPPSQAAEANFTLADLKVAEGRVTISRLGGKAKPVVLDKLGMEANRFSEVSSFPVTLAASLPAGGSLKLEGNAGPVNSGEVIATPFDAKFSFSHLDLAGPGLFDQSTGIGGIASIDGTAKSERANVAIRGRLKAEELKLAKQGKPAKRPVEIDLDLDHDLKKLVGTVRNVGIHIGAAAATLTGNYRIESEPAAVSLKLAGSNMPMTDLAAFLPAVGVVLPAGASIESGTAQVNTASQGPLGKVVTTGTVALEGVRLAHYDLASNLRVIEALAGIKAEPHTTIQTFKTDVRDSPEGTVLDNIQVTVPSIGTMTGAGTVSPSDELNFRMRLMVNSGVGSMVSSSLGSKNGIPFMIAGTAENPRFLPDVKGMATDKLRDVSGALGGNAGPASGLIDSILGGKKKRP